MYRDAILSTDPAPRTVPTLARPRETRRAPPASPPPPLPPRLSPPASPTPDPGRAQRGRSTGLGGVRRLLPEHRAQPRGGSVGFFSEVGCSSGLGRAELSPSLWADDAETYRLRPGTSEAQHTQGGAGRPARPGSTPPGWARARRRRAPPAHPSTHLFKHLHLLQCRRRALPKAAGGWAPTRGAGRRASQGQVPGVAGPLGACRRQPQAPRRAAHWPQEQ